MHSIRCSLLLHDLCLLVMSVSPADALFTFLVFVFAFRIDMHEMLGRVSKVLEGHPKLMDKFNRLLPPGMPLSTYMHIDVEVFVVFVQ